MAFSDSVLDQIYPLLAVVHWQRAAKTRSQVLDLHPGISRDALEYCIRSIKDFRSHQWEEAE